MNPDISVFVTELKSELQLLAKEWDWVCELGQPERGNYPAKACVSARNKASGSQTIPVYVNESSGRPDIAKQAARFVLQVLMIKPGEIGANFLMRSPSRAIKPI